MVGATGFVTSAASAARFLKRSFRCIPTQRVGMVGATGFEPATPCAQGRCATRLRYAPTLKTFDFRTPWRRPAAEAESPSRRWTGRPRTTLSGCATCHSASLRRVARISFAVAAPVVASTIRANLPWVVHSRLRGRHDPTFLRMRRRPAHLRADHHRGCPDGLSDRHHDLRPGPGLERLHGAVDAGHAGGAGHRHEREHGEALGRASTTRPAAPRAYCPAAWSSPPAARAPAIRSRCDWSSGTSTATSAVAVRPRRGDRRARGRHRPGRRASTTTGSATDFPAGYYSPEFTPAVDGGTTLLLAHTNRTQPNVADRAARGRPADRDRRRTATSPGNGGGRPHRRARLRGGRAPGHQERPGASCARGPASTGCISTRRATSGRTGGSMPATRALPRQRDRQQPRGEPGGDRRARRLDRLAAWVPTSARRPSCARSAR